MTCAHTRLLILLYQLCKGKESKRRQNPDREAMHVNSYRFIHLHSCNHDQWISLQVLQHQDFTHAETPCCFYLKCIVHLLFSFTSTHKSIKCWSNSHIYGNGNLRHFSSVPAEPDLLMKCLHVLFYFNKACCEAAVERSVECNTTTLWFLCHANKFVFIVVA